MTAETQTDDETEAATEAETDAERITESAAETEIETETHAVSADSNREDGAAAQADAETIAHLERMRQGAVLAYMICCAYCCP